MNSPLGAQARRRCGEGESVVECRQPVLPDATRRCRSVYAEELSRGVVGIRPPQPVEELLSCLAVVTTSESRGFWCQGQPRTTSRRVAVVLGGGYDVGELRVLVSRTTSRRVAVVLGGGYDVGESRVLVTRTTKDSCSKFGPGELHTNFVLGQVRNEHCFHAESGTFRFLRF